MRACERWPEEMAQIALSGGPREAAEAAKFLPGIHERAKEMVVKSDDEGAWIALCNSVPEWSHDLQHVWFKAKDFGKGKTADHRQVSVHNWVTFLNHGLHEWALYVESLLNVRDYNLAFEFAKKDERAARKFVETVVRSQDIPYIESVKKLLDAFPALIPSATSAAQGLPVHKRVSVYRNLSGLLDAGAEEQRMLDARQFEDLKVFASLLDRADGPGASLIAVDHVHGL